MESGKHQLINTYRFQREELTDQYVPEIAQALSSVIKRSTNAIFQQQALALLNVQSIDQVQQQLESSMKKIILDSNNSSRKRKGDGKEEERIVQSNFDFE